jgi:hypothetical protein
VIKGQCLLRCVRCSEMAQYASGLVAILDKLREKRAEIQPSLDAIDKVRQEGTQISRHIMSPLPF